MLYLVNVVESSLNKKESNVKGENGEKGEKGGVADRVLGNYEDIDEGSEVSLGMIDSEPYKSLILHFNQKTMEAFLKCKFLN